MISLIPSGDSADYYVNKVDALYKGSKRKLYNILARYDISNAQELKKCIDWNISVGKRNEFSRFDRELSLLMEADRIRRIESEENPEEQYRLNVANDYLRRMPHGGIGAYDYSFTAFYCLIGRQLGWLTKDETWSYIEKLVLLAKQNYSDWHEYCIGFVVGLEYCSQNTNFNYVKEGKNRIMRLLNFLDSPMVQIKLN
ncbi:hypothetical protein D3C81_1580180 [compost metagenome]